MNISRRHLLKLLLAAPIAYTLDVEKLLWIPGQSIVVPSTYLPSVRHISYSEIIAIEMERILPKIKLLFERDDIFYAEISRR